ncbi:MAG: hypothetical protein HY067_10705 [Betaproteobacteria bacterium]|nr:hypothetical protein [Betaproteobacteria bacterium]
MSSDRTASSTRVLSVRAAIAALLALSCVAGIPRPVHADQGGPRGHEFREHEFHREQFRDSRYHHDHYYPPRGYRFNVLPPHPRVIAHGGQQFYFSGGVWYRPVRNTFIVVRPPVGIIVPVLPPFYTRVWVGPYPYYYANDVYYARGPQGYTVVEQPPGTIAMTPPPGTVVPPDNAVTELGPVDNGVQQMAPAPAVGTAPPAPVAPPPAVAQSGGNQLFIYPRQGQNADQQNRDRGECNSWAVSQTGLDPANSGGQMDPDYQRALSACLDGRGYTVK